MAARPIASVASRSLTTPKRLEFGSAEKTRGRAFRDPPSQHVSSRPGVTSETHHAVPTIDCTSLNELLGKLNCLWVRWCRGKGCGFTIRRANLSPTQSDLRCKIPWTSSSVCWGHTDAGSLRVTRSPPMAAWSRAMSPLYIAAVSFTIDSPRPDPGLVSSRR